MSVIKFYYINEYEHLSDTKILAHSHIYYELTYYYSGIGATTTEEAQYEYKPNTYAIYTPDLSHDEVHIEDTSVVCIGFIVHTDTLNLETGLYQDDDLKIHNAIERIKDEIKLHRPHYDIMLDFIVSEMVIEHTRHYDPANYKFDQVYYVIHLIDNNFNQELDIGKMAHLSGYSYHHFRHLFKDKTGFSPKTYIIQKRLEHARKLLAETNDLISDIALACGFCSSSQFSMIFKREEKLTPVQYRQKHHKQSKKEKDSN